MKFKTTSEALEALDALYLYLESNRDQLDFESYAGNLLMLWQYLHARLDKELEDARG